VAEAVHDRVAGRLRNVIETLQIDDCMRAGLSDFRHATATAFFEFRAQARINWFFQSLAHFRDLQPG